MKCFIVKADATKDDPVWKKIQEFLTGSDHGQPCFLYHRIESTTTSDDVVFEMGKMGGYLRLKRSYETEENVSSLYKEIIENMPEERRPKGFLLNTI